MNAIIRMADVHISVQTLKDLIIVPAMLVLPLVMISIPVDVRFSYGAR